MEFLLPQRAGELKESLSCRVFALGAILAT